MRVFDVVEIIDTLFHINIICIYFFSLAKSWLTHSDNQVVLVSTILEIAYHLNTWNRCFVENFTGKLEDLNSYAESPF